MRLSRTLLIVPLVLIGSLLSGCAAISGAAQRARSTVPDEMDLRAQAAQRRSEPTFDELLADGDRARNAGNVSDAAWTYLRAMRTEPSSSVPQERIGLLHLAAGDPTQAKAAFRLAVRNAPDSALAQCGLGLAHVSLGEFARAEAPLQRATELADGQWLPLLALGVLEDGRRRHPEARDYYLRALELSPSNPDVLTNLGMSYLLAGELEPAVEHLRQAFELAPENGTGRNNLGIALGRLGRYDEALDVFRRGADEASAQNNLGYVYFLNEDFETARRHFERALAEDPPNKLPIIRNLRRAEQALDDLASGVADTSPELAAIPDAPSASVPETAIRISDEVAISAIAR